MKFRVALSFLAIFLFASCSTLPKREKIAKVVANYEFPVAPRKGEAIVYLVRPSGLGR